MLEKTIEKYLEYLILIGQSETTIKQNKSMFGIFNRYLESKYNSLIYLEEINSDDIEDFIKYLKDERCLSIRTLEAYASIIRNFYNYAERKNLIIENIGLKLPKFRLHKKEINYLTEEETKEVIDNISYYEIKVMILVIYNCGLRISEAVNLKMEDVSLKNKTLKVIEGKGKKDRTIPINRNLNKILNEYLNRRSEIESAWFFVSEKSNKISRNCLRVHLERAVKKLNLKKRVTPHIFRHSFASHLVSKNVSLLVIQKLLGHSSLLATSVYLHSKREDLEEAVNRL